MQEKIIKNVDVCIIGSGTAGCTAAIYTSRAQLKTMMFCGKQIGGQLTITTDVENYPGFAKPIQGPILMQNMLEQVKNTGSEIVYENIEEIIPNNIQNNQQSWQLITSNNNIIQAKAIIIATGAEAKWLGLPAEQNYMGYGVSGCATCDGFFYKNKEVIVVGGGNTAVEETIYLSNIAKKVILIHRRDTLRAEKILQDRLFKLTNIEILWNSILLDIKGIDNKDNKYVTEALIKNVIDQKTDTIAISAIFIAIGHLPNTSIFKQYIDCDHEQYIITKSDSTETSVPGIFAAGDVQDKKFRQAVTAAGTGCMAALEAIEFINN